MGTCGGKKKKQTQNNMNKNGQKAIQYDPNTIINQQNQIHDQTKIADVLRQSISSKQNEQKQTEQNVNDKDKNINQNQEDQLQQLSKVLTQQPKSETPIIQISKKKHQDDDPAKHHWEVLDSFEIVHQKLK